MLELVVLTVVFLLYLASSQDTLKYVVDRATQKYDISYDSISGSFLKTITIYNLKYHDKLLAKEAEIDWNMRALARGEIEIESLSLKSVDFAKIQELIESTKEHNTTNKKRSDTSSLSLPDISISHLFISTLPYHIKGVDIKRFEVEIDDVNTNLEHFAIKEFSIKTDNTLFNLDTRGHLKEKVLTLKKLHLSKIDIKEIETLLANLPKNEDNSTTPFVPIQAIDIKNIQISINPYSYHDIDIKASTLQAQHLQGDIDQMLFNIKGLVSNSDTTAGTLSLSGDVIQSKFHGKSTLNLSQIYFQQFTDIIDFKSLNPLKATLTADREQIDANITLKSKQLFAGKFKKYFTAINALHTKLSFNIPTQILHATTDANVSSKYANAMQLQDRLTYDGNLSYKGSIAISELKKFPKYSLPLFNNAIIHYAGNSRDLVAKLKTDKLHLLYKMFDFKRADFILDSQALEIVKYFPEIPTFIHPLKASAHAFMALDFNATDTIMIDTNISSNALNIAGKTKIHKGKVSLKSKASVPKKSFLAKIDNNIKLHNIFPASFFLDYHEEKLDMQLLGKKDILLDDFTYDTNSTYLANELQVGEHNISLKGEQNNLQLLFHTYSLKTLQESLTALYKFEKKPYDGEVDIKATIDNFSLLNADITSRWLVYEYSLNRFAFAEKIKMQVALKENQATIKNYTFNTFLDYDRQFFASKPSVFTLDDDKITISSLWVNDQLNTTGAYHIKQNKGLFHTYTDSYHYRGKEGDITFDTDLRTTLMENKTHIEGNVHIQEGLITYESKNTYDIQDPDIIIIQEEEERLAREKEKKNNLSLDISITSKKPLQYRIPKVEVEISPDIKIWKKPQKKLEVLGRAIIEGGTYTESDKVFEIFPGEVLFGGDVRNPYLNIKAKHINEPYTINIDITGSLDSPIINFSSSPYLDQSDILSMLLFSATTESLFEGNSNSSTKAISMLGNTFAKEIVQNFGLTLDKLVISTTEEGGLGVEVGKKLSKKITVIYSNDIVQSLKVRYKHSNRFETDIMISPKSRGIDFLYKSEN